MSYRHSKASVTCFTRTCSALTLALAAVPRSHSHMDKLFLNNMLGNFFFFLKYVRQCIHSFHIRHAFHVLCSPCGYWAKNPIFCQFLSCFLSIILLCSTLLFSGRRVYLEFISFKWPLKVDKVHFILFFFLQESAMMMR